MGLENVEWEACALEPRVDRALEAFVRREFGAVPTAVPYLSASAWIVPSFVALTHYRVLARVPFRLADLISLIVSQDNSCRYCYATQRMMLRLQGVPDARIQRIEHDLVDAEIDPRERTALEFARRISGASPLAGLPDRTRLLEAGHSDAEIKELAFVAAANVFMNRVTTLPAIPPQRVERLAARWFLPWASPLARLFVFGRARHGSTRPLPAEMRSGPFSYLVLALDGLPAAIALRSMIDAALASPVISRRAKLLAFAVVARGLGCRLGESEALRLLAETGLVATEVEDIVSHLGSPRLDPVEAAIVPFARETIRYRPADIQRSARALRDRLTQEEFLEIIGVTSLANMLCRLGVIVDQP